MLFLYLLLSSLLYADTIISKESADWSSLNIVSGVAPDELDEDFDDTWYNPIEKGYNGPSFTSGGSCPFYYGKINLFKFGTVLPTPIQNKRYTSYFYKTFDGGEGYSDLKLSVLADDGAFIYLNGQLIAKDSVDGVDTFTALATKEAEEKTYNELPLIGNPQVKPGENIIAVSVHQITPTSNDLGFDIKLQGEPLGASSKLPRVSRQPYLQGATKDRMIIRWRTTKPGSSIVRYGTSWKNLDQMQVLNLSTTEHIVTLSGLEPDTRYYYQVETKAAEGGVKVGGDETFYFRTYPEADSKKPTRLWVLGDSGTLTKEKRAIYEMYQKNYRDKHTDAILMLGDNAYPRGTDDQFQEKLFDIYGGILKNTLLWSCIGNHEYVGKDGIFPYLSLHSFPTKGECGGVPSGTEFYYSYDVGNIHIISLDSQTPGHYNDEPGRGGMIDWLELDLQATEKDWIIAIFHHGPYTKGSHDSDTEIKHIHMRYYAVPLLEQYGVDLVLSGHSHSYERSRLISGHHSQKDEDLDSSSKTFKKRYILDDGNGSELGSVNKKGEFLLDGGSGAYKKTLGKEVPGAVYAVTGSAGKVSKWDTGSNELVNPRPHPVFLVNLLVEGSMVIDIQGNTLHAQYIDYKNKLRDDFTIIKEPAEELKGQE